LPGRMLARFSCAGFAMTVSYPDPTGSLRLGRRQPARPDEIVHAALATAPARA